LDVGGTKVLGVAVDPRDPRKIVAEGRVPTPDGGDGLVDTLLDLAATLAPTASGIGVGVPGLVDRSGTLHMGPHLRRMQEVPLARLLAERAGVPAVVDNDANCHAIGEQATGAAAGAADALVVTLGTGIGAGIITGGEVLRGANGFAGEPGHMVIDPSGPPCPCGKRGCWEQFASGSGLARLAREAAVEGRLDAAVALAGGDPSAVRGEHVTASARAGDVASQAVLDSLARWIALGLANLVNVLDPAIIVIGGGLVEAADLLLPEVRSRVSALVMAGEQRPVVSIVPAELGEHAGAIGAALLAASAPTQAATGGQTTR
jgi:glucokinase